MFYSWSKKQWTIVTVGCVIFVGIAIGLAIGLDRLGNDLPVSRSELPVSLAAFSPSMLNGYGECSNFVSDLEEMSKYMANVHIDRMALQHYHGDYFYSMPRGGRGSGNILETMTAMAEDSAPTPKTGEDSYGTNNQVDGVDEADSVKSDGKHVYAAYGDNLVVWDAINGAEVSRTIIPTTDDEGVALCEDESNSKDSCYENYGYQKMNIVSLLMYQNRITAVVQSPYQIRDQDFTMYGSHATRLFVYDKSIPSSKGPLTLIAQKDLQGFYQSGRLIDQYAHIVTSSGVNAWSQLYQHLNPMKFVDKRRKMSRGYYPGYDLSGLNENEYRNAANAKAAELIPSFAQRLASESLGSASFSSEDCTKITHLALFSKGNSQKNEENTVTVPFTTATALSNFAQVISFDILNAAGGNDALSTSSSGIFIPFNSYSKSVYSSRDKLIVAGEGYEENSDGVWEERTILFAFGLDSATSNAESIGVVPGSLLNQFSMDHYIDGDDGDDYLRVATTSWGQWGEVNGSWRQTEESSSQVTVLNLPFTGNQAEATAMTIVGQASDLGKGERIYAVRFLGTRAFVVTFRQIDPFYTLNMEDPTNPQVVGELKIPGFSNYLHPIGDGNLILAVGQDANEEGRVQGLQVAMYNVTDFANPTQIKKFSEGNSGAYSSAQYDHQAFRYLPDTEVLILPLSQYTTSFDGFVVYDVPVDPEANIEERFKISHVDKDMQTCWSDASLTARSLVFGGDVTTMKGHTILSHVLNTKVKRWALNLDVDREDSDNDHCGYWEY